jgi:hypothetical protein
LHIVGYILEYCFLVYIFPADSFSVMANYPVSLTLCKRTLIFNMTNQPLLGCNSGEFAAPPTKNVMQTPRKVIALATLLTLSLECFDADNQSIILETSTFSPLQHLD